MDQFRKSPEARPVRIEWKPFMIDPSTKREGEEYNAYCRRRWGGDGWTRSLRAKGQKNGANFANWKWWPNTLKAHQLVVYFADNKGADTSRCNRALFEALYEEGQNLSDVDTLVSIAVEKLGLPEDEKNDLRAFLERDAAAMNVERDIHHGRAKYRISGVPFFVIGQDPPQQGQRPYGFSGAQPPDAFLKIFNELAE